MWEKLNLAHSSAAVRFLTSSKTIANQSSTPLSPPCTECVLAWILKGEREIMRAKNFWLEEIDGISKINAIIPARNLGKSHLLSHPTTSYLSPGSIATTSKVPLIPIHLPALRFRHWHLSLSLGLYLSPPAGPLSSSFCALVCRALFLKQKFDGTTSSIFQWLHCLQGKV